MNWTDVPLFAEPPHPDTMTDPNFAPCACPPCRTCWTCHNNDNKGRCTCGTTEDQT